MVTSRVLSMYEEPNPSFRNVAKQLKYRDLEVAEILWYKDAKTELKHQLTKGEFKRLCPKIRDGIIVEGNHAVEWGDVHN